MNEFKELPELREMCPTSSRKALGDGALLLDLRAADDVARVGFAGCDVLAIPLEALEARLGELPRGRQIIAVAETPEGAKKAGYFLLYQGFEQVAAMNPGLARWVAKGFPSYGDTTALGGACGAGGCCA